MTRHLISTGSPFERSFGYSRAVVDGDFVFVSGTTGYDYATMTLPEDPAAQARNVFKTIGAVLEEAGLVHTRREGRYKFHHVDTSPLRAIVERWPIDAEEADS